jgi:hypothetical protein
MSVDGTPISRADLARIEAEERLHAEQQKSAVRVVAAAATDADECRMLLSMLGLTPDVVSAARGDMTSPAVKRPRKRRAAA